MKKSILILLPVAYCLLLFTSCKYSNESQLINANNKFSIAVPSWMKEDKSLKPGADFQYANHFRNFYAIGETVSKDGLKRAAGEIMNDNLNILRKSMPSGLVSDSTNITSNGVNGIRVEFFGKMSNENIYFSEVIFETQKKIYHLSIWTRGENRKLHFKEEINKIISSFKEI